MFSFFLLHINSFSKYPKKVDYFIVVTMLLADRFNSIGKPVCFLLHGSTFVGKVHL